jgi:hypothetical protein
VTFPHPMDDQTGFEEPDLTPMTIHTKPASFSPFRHNAYSILHQLHGLVDDPRGKALLFALEASVAGLVDRIFVQRVLLQHHEDRQ